MAAARRRSRARSAPTRCACVTSLGPPSENDAPFAHLPAARSYHPQALLRRNVQVVPGWIEPSERGLDKGRRAAHALAIGPHDAGPLADQHRLDPGPKPPADFRAFEEQNASLFKGRRSGIWRV